MTQNVTFPGKIYVITLVNTIAGKSSESVQCAITGTCLRMRHRPSA